MRELALAVGLVVSAAAPAVDVAVDLGTRFQRIEAWGGTPIMNPMSAALRDEMWDVLVEDLGLTRARLEPSRWEVENDNGDPFALDGSRIDTAWVDGKVAAHIVPFRQRVLARGDRFWLYVSPSFFNGGSSGEAQPWLYQSPGEYTEYALSVLDHLKATYSIEPDYWSICNEAGNGNVFSATVVQRIARELGPRMLAAGYRTRLEFPENVNADTSWSYIQAVQNDAALWPFVGLVTWHLYGGNASRPSIAAFAQGKGIPTGQTEFLSATFDDLLDDLDVGRASVWEQYGINGYGAPGNTTYVTTNYAGTGLSYGLQYWKWRQMFHYVRPGALRVGATSNDASVRAAAFWRDGLVSVVVANLASGAPLQTVHVSGLPPGRYGVAVSTGSQPVRELGIRDDAAGVVTFDLPGDSVGTVYSHAGANLPPAITKWTSTPSYLTAPASSVALSSSAVDPEGDSLAFAWTVASQPAGASVTFSTPSAANTNAAGLTAAGDYAFRITVSDGQASAHRDVLLTVFAGNQPPYVFDVHNRNPKYVTLPGSATNLRSAAIDLEGDALAYQWEIVSQPGGAAATLAAPTTAACAVSNLSVAGDYLFRVTVTEGGGLSTSVDLPLKVYPADNPPSVAASASPASLTLPTTSTSLVATTSDPDGDVLTHWWRVVSAPASAAPAFANPGAPSTTVSGLTAVGSYVFELAAIARTQATARQVTVTVAGGAGNQAPVVSAGPDLSVALPDRALLLGSGTDDGLPSALAFSWTQVSGPASASFNQPSAPMTNASFPAAGTYVLRLTASDSSLSASDDVAVTVTGSPPVEPGDDAGTGADAGQDAGGGGTPDGGGGPNPPGGCGCGTGAGQLAAVGFIVAFALLLARRRPRAT